LTTSKYFAISLIKGETLGVSYRGTYGRNLLTLVARIDS
jgi:hypothetical protein